MSEFDSLLGREEGCMGGVTTERALEQAELLSEMIDRGLLTGTLSKDNLSMSCISACMNSHQCGAILGHGKSVTRAA